MKKFHIDRLEKLYNFLGTVKPKKFNFGAWAESDTGTMDVNVCGSTACALGWAASMPAFRKRGLRLEWEQYGDEEWGDLGADANVVLRDKSNSMSYGTEAGEEFFGLTEQEAEYLFIPDGQGDDPGMGPSDMTLAQYRRGLRRFIDKKKRQLGYK